MTLHITQVELISVLVGVLLGYKGKSLIQGWINSIKKAIASATAIK